jgi:hypothetical protein
MKRFMLPVLTWTLAISQLFAQHQIPKEAHYYVTELSKTSQLLLERAGLLKPAAGENEQLETRATDLRLDSTETFHLYTQTDSVPQSLTWYMYPEANVTVNIDFGWDVDHWIISNRTTTITDDLGRTVDIFAQRWDETLGNYVPESRLEVFPRGDSHSLIDSFFVSRWDENQTWTREFSTWNAYGNNDLLQESASEFVFFGETLTLLDRYHYIANRLDKVETFQVFEGEEMLGSVTFYLYQNDVLRVTMTNVAAGIGELVPESREEYTFNAAGLLELQNHFIYDFEKQDWKFTGADSYIYDEEGREYLHEVVSLDEVGIMTRTLTTSDYIRDEHLAMQTHAVYDNNIEDWAILDRIFYHYSEVVAVDPELPADAEVLVMYPNPSNGTVNIGLDEDATVYVYGLNGQLVATTTTQGRNNTLDLNMLPAGLYQVRASTETAHYAGKLVKQ